MNPKVYEEKRNQLIGLMDEVLALPADILNDDARKPLNRVMRKSRENQFQIALIGRYQGGKSTTFNALCEGMEISPRGKGIKTSATVITAQNTTDPTEVGTATVVWRSKEELASVFVYLISHGLRQRCPDIFENKETTAEKLFDLDNAVHREVGQACLGDIWENWEKNKSGFSEDQLDTLRIGSIILAFYASEEIDSIRKRAQAAFKVEDVGVMVKFPTQWERRWTNADPRVFKPNEVLFAFIREINCKIDSPNLARIGCRITDCPGLFASPYDTKVAMEVLSQSDAVWYLLSGKQIAETDLRQIKSVVTSQGDNVFFTLNMDQPKKNINDPESGIVATDIACLKNNGISRKTEDIHQYHARLALCASNGDRILTDSFDKHSSDTFLRSVRDSADEEDDIQTVADAWRNTIEIDLGVLKVASRKDITGLDKPSIEIVRKESGLDEILSAVEKHVVSRKAKSILVDKGAGLATATLEKVEGDLKAAADDARSTEEEFKNEYDKAGIALTEFQRFCKEELEPLSDSSGRFLDEALARDFWKRVILEAIPDMANAAAPRIHESIGFWGMDKKMAKDGLTSAFEDVTQAWGIHWQLALENGENRVYNEGVLSIVKRVEERARKKWAEIVLSAPRLEGIPVPDMKISYIGSPGEILDNLKIPGLWTTMFGQTFWIALVGGIVTALLGIPVFWALLVAIVLGEVFEDTEFAEKEKIRKLRESLQKSLPESLEKTHEKAIADISDRLSAFRSAWIDTYEDGFKKQRKALEDRRKKAEKEHQSKVEERMAKADKYDQIRTKHIEPIRLKLQAYCRDVISVL